MEFKDLKFVNKKLSFDENKIQCVLLFPNGYGVSIIRGKYSYGGDHLLYEIAVLKGKKKKWKLTYETPITANVLGHLMEQDVMDTINQVKKLPKRANNG